MGIAAFLSHIAGNPRLPTPPAVALRVFKEAARPECSLAEIAAILKHDPAFCARLLKIVNSSFYGTTRSVTSIDRALGLLGLKRVRSLALGLSLPAMQRKPSNPAMRSFWTTAVTQASAARQWAENARRADSEDEMVTALLCDIGSLILMETCPEKYEVILHEKPETLVHGQCELEERLLGFNHAELGAEILHQWGLPEEITETIRHHHFPERAANGAPLVAERTARLHLACCIAQMQLAPQDRELFSKIVRLARERFHLNEQQLLAWLEPLNKQIDELARLMQVETGPCPHYGSLLAGHMEALAQLASDMALENIRAEERVSQTEDALRQSEEQLRQMQKMETISSLASGVAHDFNNMLTVITGYTDLLLESFDLPEAVQDILREIRKAGERSERVTRQLLTLCRRQVLDPQVLDLNAVVRDVEKMLNRLIGEDINLSSVLAPSLGPIEADLGQIQQILLNLAVNARDAMPGGGSLTIETANTFLEENRAKRFPGLAAGPYIRLTVTDTGCGMDEATRLRIFEPFFTTKEPGKGTGLGLATIQGIVKKTGGAIEVLSEPGKGACFHIYLPRLAAMSPSVLRVLDQSAAHPKGKPTLLLVVEDESVRSLMCTILGGQDYRVLAVADDAHALQLAEGPDTDIDLLITETVLPDWSGSRLAEQLAMRFPRLKVLYLSSFPEDAELQPDGADQEMAFLQKPFSQKDLVRKIDTLLGRLKTGSDLTTESAAAGTARWPVSRSTAR